MDSPFNVMLINCILLFDFPEMLKLLGNSLYKVHTVCKKNWRSIKTHGLVLLAAQCTYLVIFALADLDEDGHHVQELVDGDHLGGKKPSCNWGENRLIIQQEFSSSNAFSIRKESRPIPLGMSQQAGLNSRPFSCGSGSDISLWCGSGACQILVLC